jgi:crotonobetainyl-CoA:carnitine CoA-transferase CaiB-like acyl-CoA transferase
MESPLANLRIVDMSSVVMGPFVTQVLGDLGADVIKVESPQGDTTRHVAPMRNENMGWVFLHANRNKRSIVLDLKDPAGKDALIKILASADALVTNVRTKALSRLGLDYESLASTNPRLIVMNLVGYGEDGPYAGRPAYEDLIQGATALPSLLVRAGSEHPHYVPMAFNDRGRWYLRWDAAPSGSDPSPEWRLGPANHGANVRNDDSVGARRPYGRSYLRAAVGTARI